MEKKNKVLLILVGVLLLTIGGSLAYFVARSLTSGTGGKLVATTTTISGATLKVEGTLEFNDTDVYPGHTVVSGIKVTATGDNKLIPYNLVWNGLSEISGLNFKVYKTSSTVDVTSSCEKKIETVKGMQQYFEECEINNLDKLGTEIATGSINKNDTKAILVKDEFITATSDGQVVYYYIILEYPNLDMNQNVIFEGKVTVEENNKSGATVLAIKLEQEDGTYKDSDIIPTEGYILNTEKSTCSNEAIPSYDTNTKTFTARNLTKNGTSCYLTFDKMKGQTSATIIANIKNRTDGSYKGSTMPTFTSIATEAETEDNNGIFETDDPMYGTNAKTYYWRGAATTNHVIFDSKCWRIVRINGDRSIRLIYNGTPTGNICPGNGSNSSSVVLQNTAYNGTYNNSKYVGWSYASGDSQRPSTSNPQTSGTRAPLRVQLEDTWYANNISASAKTKLAIGKFCNDRNTKDNETWIATGLTQYYAAYARTNEGTKTPTLSCPTGDVYELSVGMITADEVQFAGVIGGTSNTSYYLYNGQFYWTMSPYMWNGNGNYAYVFFVRGDVGSLDGSNVNWTVAGVRPVINLRSDVIFNSGSDGTSNNPYIVQ